MTHRLTQRRLRVVTLLAVDKGGTLVVKAMQTVWLLVDKVATIRRVLQQTRVLQ
jgi:hypothetical protein